MQVTKKKINAYTVELTIKESSAEFQKAKKAALAEISQNANIKWFRKWATIPEEVLEKTYWKEMIEAQAIDEMINMIYPKALKKENIIPTWPANLKDLKSKDPFEIVLEVEVLPEITIDEKALKKVKIKKQTVEAKKEEVEMTIKEIEKRFIKFEEIEGTNAELQDKVTIDTIWHDKKWWAEIAETRVKAFPLVLWSGSFIPWFEDKLVWSKVWDTVEFEITFPADYHSKEFQSRKVFFVANVLKIEKALKPEWTDDFIEQLRWVKTDFAWFKEIIEKEILEEKERRARYEDETKLLAELEKIAKIELGSHLIEHETERVYSEHKHDLEAQGINISHYLEHLKKDELTYKKEAIEPEALRRLKAELILEKLKEIVKAEVTDEEVNEEIERILSQYTSIEVKEKLKAKLVPGDTYYEDMKNRLKYKKIVDSFFE